MNKTMDQHLTQLAYVLRENFPNSVVTIKTQGYIHQADLDMAVGIAHGYMQCLRFDGEPADVIRNVLETGGIADLFQVPKE